MKASMQLDLRVHSRSRYPSHPDHCFCCYPERAAQLDHRSRTTPRQSPPIPLEEQRWSLAAARQANRESSARTGHQEDRRRLREILRAFDFQLLPLEQFPDSKRQVEHSGRTKED